MKSKEEINDLAEIHANQEMEVYKSMDLPKGTKQAIFTHCLVSYNIGYTQCQEDMADKDKWTFEEILDACYPTLGRGSDWCDIAIRLKEQKNKQTRLI